MSVFRSRFNIFSVINKYIYTAIYLFGSVLTSYNCGIRCYRGYCEYSILIEVVGESFPVAEDALPSLDISLTGTARYSDFRLDVLFSTDFFCCNGCWPLSWLLGNASGGEEEVGGELSAGTTFSRRGELAERFMLSVGSDESSSPKRTGSIVTQELLHRYCYTGVNG